MRGAPGPCGCGCALSAATSLGFSAVDFAEQVVGIGVLPWQRWLLIHALELRADGRFRYRTVVILVARQNGKTTLVEVKNLWKMFVLQVPLILGTAQNLDTSEESWDKAVEIVESVPDLAAELEHVDRTNGKKALRLKNGSRWKIAAASRKGGRGLSGDDVNLDELREHHTWESWAAVTKTTMARRNSQVWAFSNAGDDRSVVLNDLQDKGRAAAANPLTADPGLGLFEWSAPDDCPIDDPQFWAMANPSLGYTITEEALRSALGTDPEAIFRTECLCQRVPDLGDRAIDPAAWVAMADPESKRTGDIALGVDIAPQRNWAAIVVYGRRDDVLGHAQLVEYRAGTDWIVGRLAELADALKPVAIGMGRGTAASLEVELAKAGLSRPKVADEPEHGDLAVTNSVDMAAACGQILDAVRQAAFRYVPAEPLDRAVAGAKTRQVGDTIAWARKDADADTSPLVALTVARWAFESRAHLVAEPYDPLANIF